MRFRDGETIETVLSDVSIELSAEASCVLLGPSGSGKTTLLSILGCLLTPSEGVIEVGGIPLPRNDLRAMQTVRREKLGFIFQHAQLLPFLGALENVALAARNAGMPTLQARTRAKELFGRLGLEAVAAKYPGQLSGGQRQRVAVARALAHRPAVVLANEPTAALDWENGEAVIQLLLEETQAAGAALLLVTHDRRLVPKFRRVFEMTRGQLEEQTPT